MKSWFLIGAVMLLANAVGASAQTMMDTSTLNLGIQQMSQTAYLSNSIFNTNAALGYMREDIRRAKPADAKAGSRPSSGTVAERKGASNSRAVSCMTSFRPVAEAIVPQKLAAQASTPEARQKLASLFADCLRNYKSEGRKAGIALNDVARATSFFIATAYNVAANARLTPGQVEALRNDVRQVLQTSEGFQTASDHEKQETYETMAILGEYIATGYVVGVQQKRPEIQRAFRAVAKDQLERFLGTSLRNIKFTETGIEF